MLRYQAGHEVMRTVDCVVTRESRVMSGHDAPPATLDDDARSNREFGSARTAAPAYPRPEATSRAEASRCRGSAGKKRAPRGSAASRRECGATGWTAGARSAQSQQTKLAADR